MTAARRRSGGQAAPAAGTAADGAAGIGADPGTGSPAVTLSDLLGAVAASVTRAGAIADDASVGLARSYLQDDVLRSFPVPHAAISDLEVTFRLAILGGSAARGPLDDAMADRLAADLAAFAHRLPDDPAFGALFGAGGLSAKAWRSGGADLGRSVKTVLGAYRGRQAEDAVPDLFAAFARALAHAVEATPPARPGFFGRLFGWLPGVGRRAPRIDRPLLDRLSDALRLVVAAGAAAHAAAGAGSAPDLRVAVTAEELAGLDRDRLQTVVVRLAAGERRWIEVAMEGEPARRLGQFPN